MSGLIQRAKARVGVITVGHEPYWGQFAGLKEELQGNGKKFEDMLRKLDVEVVSAGFVDNVDQSFAAAARLKAADVDFLFCNLSTYVTSSSAATAILNLSVPTVLVALQPLKKLDYRHTTTYMQLANDNICSLPEISGVLVRAGKPAAGMIVGTLGEDARAERELAAWCQVANARRAFKYARIGYLGHTYEGMYDMNSDPTAFTAAFGSHIQMLEMCDLAKLVNGVTPAEMDDKLDEIHSVFTLADPFIDPITRPIRQEDLDWSAKVAVGLDKLVSEYGLTGLAYYYRGLDNNEYERISSNMVLGNSLLTAKGIPLAGEADLKTCAAMLIMDRLGGGGSFAELHPCDFEDDIVLVGHDGPHDIRISDGKPVIRGLDVFHGKSGSGIGVEFSIKTGPVTLLGISQTADGRFKMIAAEGESVQGEIPQTGNTNTRCSFGCRVAEFVENWCAAGPTHHFALGVGHLNARIKNVAHVLGIELEVVQGAYKR
ncbi:L-fucose/L-arabinose isomerase family protein [Paenibacillus lautus]|jgi:L-arabinose isomerase|uniref:Arabinose isomerase n=1 Tax=Paenibacillus lautus TaxID=1401 RepID=A0A2A5LDP9_PAELA|nr:L-fucose/L-arabinose isomerase family protein [Paenibacillus lautus]AYB42801.1 arabinose isomerase [Paenibacillus lautus]MBY0160664.1 L-fucose/L-arabinose isomerase family protein [Cytobacillus firmus]MCI1773595.1 L-fucose/L-arabinose isomerase family protein [Paenibacillus lautus]PCL90545.1 arabinose isomerase [Paenibacillus lautus]